MSKYESVSDKVIDEAYELCERLKEEAEEIGKEKALLDDLYKQHQAKPLVTPTKE